MRINSLHKLAIIESLEHLIKAEGIAHEGRAAITNDEGVDADQVLVNIQNELDEINEWLTALQENITEGGD